jgi:hypothetical protein
VVPDLVFEAEVRKLGEGADPIRGGRAVQEVDLVATASEGVRELVEDDDPSGAVVRARVGEADDHRSPIRSRRRLPHGLLPPEDPAHSVPIASLIKVVSTGCDRSATPRDDVDDSQNDLAAEKLELIRVDTQGRGGPVDHGGLFG